MDAIFQFSSAQEITEEFIEMLKDFYKDQSISITITGDFHVPEWQKEEVLRRQADIKNHPESLMDFDEMMTSLEKELESES